MRITCNVEIANRLLPTLNVAAASKMVRADLAIGKKPGADKHDSMYLMITTKQDRNGAKYKLEANVEKVFSRFVAEGKATLRFVSPPHDVKISKVDGVQLKSFLSVIHLGVQGRDTPDTHLTSLAPVSSKQVEKLQTRLSVTTRKNYPITTNFPSSLQYLQIVDCNLKKVDGRILQLRYLTVIDLSRNRLVSLPPSLGDIANLRELYLSNNHLDAIPNELSYSSINQTLHLLDISFNKFTNLRPSFCQFNSLQTLKLDGNQLQCLPQRFGHLQSLRVLTITGNQLKILPASFSMLRLDTLDLFDNEFMTDGPSSARSQLSFPSLMECVAKCIAKSRLPYSEEELPGALVQYLWGCRWCTCGQPCFTSYVHYLGRLPLSKVSRSVTAVDRGGRMHAPLEAFLCSTRCLELYQKNPLVCVWR